MLANAIRDGHGGPAELDWRGVGRGGGRGGAVSLRHLHLDTHDVSLDCPCSESRQTVFLMYCCVLLPDHCPVIMFQNLTTVQSQCSNISLLPNYGVRQSDHSPNSFNISPLSNHRVLISQCCHLRFPTVQPQYCVSVLSTAHKENENKKYYAIRILR